MYCIRSSYTVRSALCFLVLGLNTLWAQPFYLGEHKLCDGITLKEPAPPEFVVNHHPETGRIQISGSFDIGLAAVLGRVLSQDPSVSVIELNSVGGNIYQGRAVANLIEEYHLDTYVDTRCYSACALAFMAGKRRILGSEGELGFHGYGFANLLTPPNADPLKEQQRDLAWYAERISDKGFLSRIFEADCSSLWIPTRDELLAAGVVEPDYAQPLNGSRLE